MTSITFKLSLNSEIRRFSVPQDDAKSFQQVQDLVRKTFSQTLGSQQQFTLRYQDEEQDWITLSSDLELEEAYRPLNAKDTNPLLRLQVVLAKQPNPQSTGCPAFIGMNAHPLMHLFQRIREEEKNNANTPCSPRREAQAQGWGCGWRRNMAPRTSNNNNNNNNNQKPKTGCQEAPQGQGRGCGWRRNIINNNHNSAKDKHWGIICDGCGEKHIQGKRFYCLDCAQSVPGGVDFCEKCFEKEETMAKVHPSSHSLLEIAERNHGFALPRISPFCNWRRSQSPAEPKKETNTASLPQSMEPEDRTTQPLVALRQPTDVSSEKIESSPVSPLMALRQPTDVSSEKIESSPVSPLMALRQPTNSNTKQSDTEKEQQQKSRPLTSFEEKLNQLSAMGFANKEENITLLLKTKGDLVEAIKLLLA